MSFKVYFFLVTFVVLSTNASADIFRDLLGWDFIGTLTGQTQKETTKIAAKREENSGNTCDCEGSGCNCCVDFNITSIIDLGGPGCVRMKYISQDEGVSLNVSYGDSLLHSKVVKQKDKKGSCMNLLSEFAQICAKFDDLKPLDDGLQGCLHFEPHVLGEVTSEYPIGCFRMNSDGMVLDTTVVPTEEPAEEESSPTEDQEDEEDEETPSIIDVVNQSAEQGIAFFSDLLGIKVPGKKTKTTTEKSEVAEESSAAPEEDDADDDDDDNSESRSLGSVKTSEGRTYLSNEVS